MPNFDSDISNGQLDAWFYFERAAGRWDTPAHGTMMVLFDLSMGWEPV